MQRRIIPDIVNHQSIYTVSPESTILDASKLMGVQDVGALLVVNAAGLLAGILTERDITRRVVAQGRDPKTLKVGDVMTKKPDIIGPDDSALEALEMMRSRRYRHVPVVQDGRAVGMVSIRDLYEVVKEELEHSIKETEAFVFGDRYGA
jgi:CBS domain-containing protein